jgi:hypothetical protein
MCLMSLTMNSDFSLKKNMTGLDFVMETDCVFYEVRCPSARHEGVWESQYAVKLTLNFKARWRQLVSFALLSLYHQ